MTFHQILWNYSKKEQNQENRDLLVAELNALVDAGENPMVVPANYPDVFGLSTLKNIDAIKFASGLGMFSVGAGLRAYYHSKLAKDNPPTKLDAPKRRRAVAPKF